MIDIVIPMAGSGRRFREAGYTVDKPDIPIAGRRMIERVRDCLTPSQPHRFVYLTRNQVGETRGAVETILKGAAWINQKNPVLLANCDQWISHPVDQYLRWSQESTHDATLMTFNSTNPHHSYVRLEYGLLTDIVEKQVISDDAVLGVYWFTSGELLLDYAAKVLAGEPVLGEYYVSSIFELLIRDAYHIGAYEIGVKEKAMLGTPEELAIFLDKIADGRVVL